jgi:hypothetical protein
MHMSRQTIKDITVYAKEAKAFDVNASSSYRFWDMEFDILKTQEKCLLVIECSQLKTSYTCKTHPLISLVRKRFHTQKVQNEC